MRQIFEDYISRTTQIRDLARPHLKLIDHEEHYGQILASHFRQIGELAGENRRVISEELGHMTQDPDVLTGEDIDELIGYARALINGYHLESVDSGLGWYISDYLYNHVFMRMDLRRQLMLLELHLHACYQMCLRLRRIEAVSSLAEDFRQQGLAIFYLFEDYLEKLETLPDEDARVRVIRNVRFGHCMYEGERSDEESRRHDIEGLERLYHLGDSPRVRELLPGLNWEHHRFRTLEYLALSVDYGNIRGFSLEELKHLNRYAIEFEEIWRTDPERYGKATPGGRVRLTCLLNAFYAGEMEEDAYKAGLIDLMQDELAQQDYGGYAIYSVFHASLAYMMCVEGRPLSQQEERDLTQCYRAMMECALHSRDTAVESYTIELIALALEHFIEVPEVNLEKMALTCMAALHTPTYIHSLMVGDLARYMTGELLARSPERFIGLLGCRDVKEVQREAARIQEHAYHAALIHDVGKISVIDTIFIYERNLLDFEFDRIIKAHPQMGRYVLSRLPSTEAYGAVAQGHHRWYNDSFGYPQKLRTVGDPQKVLVDIVECADCMDAATDQIGRSYSKGKTLQEYIEEVREGAGTRYAPWLMDILGDPAVQERLEEMLTTGREKHYTETYLLLK